MAGTGTCSQLPWPPPRSSPESNGNFSVWATVHSDKAEWTASPSPSVDRKRFELWGPPEAGRVTSLVRYSPDSTFNSHGHPDGEEILVLEGTFSDEHGSYPAGTFVLNPEGFVHAPFSKGGCSLFVKLRQFGGLGRDHLSVDTSSPDADWVPAGSAGIVHTLDLYDDPNHPEKILLARFPRGSCLPISTIGWGGVKEARGLVEVFVVEGACTWGAAGELRKYSWARTTADQAASTQIENGSGDTLVYIKYGHQPPNA
ncbi:unnamed protein product [Chrysoparadoxa australica]